MKNGSGGEEEGKCRTAGALREEMPRCAKRPPETEVKFMRGTANFRV
jgi:hypothetical protein